MTSQLLHEPKDRRVQDAAGGVYSWHQSPPIPPLVMNPIRRGRRFPVSWPVQYRRASDAEWLDGRTVNMSISGVLFVANSPPSPDDSLDLSIVIEGPDPRVPSSRISMTGRVVRTDPTVPGAVAVEFSHLGPHNLRALGSGTELGARIAYAR